MRTKHRSHAVVVSATVSNNRSGVPERVWEREEAFNAYGLRGARGGAEAEVARDVEEDALPEEELVLGPIVTLRREGHEPGAELNAVGVVTPLLTATATSHHRRNPHHT
ncbi:hypothetical protein GUJ93_ZPchr0001g33022 [Zizania palustris]|uniref:Uncharacterized protein n=1 Tax=Zizania palustris TaxID=103762 RepID=A0A8J5VLF3_ZIZPA|nr:hypothetical protein GUJ93_ZPchr0001g33022 [Zizania palustris]